ncbi:fibro-slime domain-containing protein [Eubacterium limosum]|uniref:DUF7601 domain-containing protein n=1 Tax=Eubacterium limosum TaxID=1736 RepID=UPI0037222EA7
MKSVKRLSRYTSILLSMLLMLSAMSPGISALAQERANAAPTVLTYEDDSITAELKATGGTSLPAGAALTVKALNKDSQDEAEKALYAETEVGLKAKASEQGSSIDSFTAYSITLIDKNKRDITPKTGSFTLKLTDKNAAAPEAYKQSPDGQKSIELYQAAEAKDEQNNPVSTMEPKQEDAASINTDPDGNVTEVETALTTLKPVAVTWQNPQPQAMEEENAPSVQSSPELANNQFSYQFEVNGKLDASNLVIDFKENNMWGADLNISELLGGETSAIKKITPNTDIPIEDFMPEGLNSYQLRQGTFNGSQYFEYVKSINIKTNSKSGEILAIEIKSNDNRSYNILGESYKLYFSCMESLKTIPTIDSASKGVEIQMFDYPKALPDWANPYSGWGIKEAGQLSQGLLKRTLGTDGQDEKIPDRMDGMGLLDNNFSKTSGFYKGNANYLFSEDAYNADGTFSYSSFDNYAYLDQSQKDEMGNSKFTVYHALGTPVDNDQAFCYQRGNFFPYNKINKGAPAENNKNYYDENGKRLESNAPRYGETLYQTLNDSGNPDKDYYFGMVTTASFSQLKDGQMKDKAGNIKPMVYNFNGDDDMWVFIDDILVLDLGGVHDAQSGSIDFATGQVKWTNNKSLNGVVTEKESGETTILDQFEKAKAEKKTEWKGDTFADYTGHEIKIFYMERGAGASNCKMTFNLPTVPKDSVSITKEVTNVNEGAYTDVNFAFKLYVESKEGESVEGKEIIEQDGTTYVLATDQPYDLKEGTDIIKADEKTNSVDGIFTLKHGQTAYFEEIATQGQKYIVQEVGVNQDQYDEFKVTANATDEAGVNVNAIEQEDGTKIVQTAPLTVGTNTIVKMQNQCNGKNLHTINITKQIDGGQASDDNFTAQVTIGGKPYTGKYKVADKDATEEAWKSAEEKTTADGSISLKASQTIRIEKIAAGTSFEVTETAPDANKYNTPTYDVSNADAIDKTDKASGKVNFGSNPQITIINHLKLSEDSISTNKTAKVHDWDDRTYDITLQASSNVTGDVVSSVPYDIVMVLDKSGSMNNEFLNLAEYTEDTFKKNDEEIKYYYKTQSGIYQKLNVKEDDGTDATYIDTEDGGKTKTVTLKKDTVYYRAEYIKWDEPYFEGDQTPIGLDSIYTYYYKVADNEIIKSDDNKTLNFQGKKYVQLYLINESKAKLYSYKTNDDRNTDVYKTVDIKDIVDQVYIANPIGKSKRAALEEASTQFISNVSQLSPDSRISIINFASTVEIEKSDEKTFLRVGNLESLNTLKDWTKSHFLATHTRADLGLEAAEKVLNDSDKSHWEAVKSDKERKKMVVFFTDGIPTGNLGNYNQNTENKAIAAAKRLRDTNGATVYALGVFDWAFNNGTVQEKFTVKQLNNYMTQVAGDPSRYMVANDADSLNKLFSSISTDVGQSIEGATISDVIDSRFELTDEAKAALEASRAIVTVNDTGTTTITWNDQTINQSIGDTAGWERTFRVRAKEDYIGANNVTTNAAGSQVQVGEITKPFESPVVNVKADISLLDQANTIFWDETVPASGALIDRVNALQTLIDKNVKDYKVPENSLNIVWTNENGVSYSIEAMTKDKPEKDTYYTVNVSYDAGEPSDPSTVNTDGHKNGDDNNTITAQGKYDVHVVKGQLEITKTIDEPYTNIKQINANQTFVFKIERREEKDGDVKETFYETINFDANDTNTNAKTKSKLVSGLKKGYYTVTEETNWSQKYDLTETTNNYDKNNKAAVDLLIGDRLREATQDNPKPEFYGLDETKLKDNSGAELPPAQQYSHFAEGSKATVKFTNKLNTNWKWLSDTAAAVNVFDQKAQ